MRPRQRHGEPAADYIARRTITSDNGCWYWEGHRINRYPAASIDGRLEQLNRYILTMKLGRPIGDGLVAMHSCDDRRCIRPDHLSEGTYAGNMHDMMAKGRQVIGQRRGQKLTPEIVRAIRAECVIHSKGDRSAAALARKYGVSSVRVCAVVSGAAWKDVR